MKKIIAMTVVLCGLALGVNAEDRIGFQIQVYVEPNEENSLHVNVLPVMYEFGIGNNFSAKMGSVFSLRFAETISVGNVGISATLPYYFGGQFGSRDFSGRTAAIFSLISTHRRWCTFSAESKSFQRLVV